MRRPGAHAQREDDLRYIGMNIDPKASQRGAWGWGLLWLIGIPVPILLILFVLRGCT